MSNIVAAAYEHWDEIERAKSQTPPITETKKKYKKVRFSTKLYDLYGDEYTSHIEVGKEYWEYFETGTEIYKKTGQNYNKIKVTYIRSGCMFYTFCDAPELPEEYCSVSSFKAMNLIVAEIDPIKDLESIKESDKDFYCFDNTYTIVKNWPNEPVSEIDGKKFYNHYIGASISAMLDNL